MAGILFMFTVNPEIYRDEIYESVWNIPPDAPKPKGYIVQLSNLIKLMIKRGLIREIKVGDSKSDRVIHQTFKGRAVWLFIAKMLSTPNNALVPDAIGKRQDSIASPMIFEDIAQEGDKLQERYTLDLDALKGLDQAGTLAQNQYTINLDLLINYLNGLKKTILEGKSENEALNQAAQAMTALDTPPSPQITKTIVESQRVKPPQTPDDLDLGELQALLDDLEFDFDQPDQPPKTKRNT